MIPITFKLDCYGNGLIHDERVYIDVIIETSQWGHMYLLKKDVC